MKNRKDYILHEEIIHTTKSDISPEVSITQTSLLRNRKILLVEDDPVYQVLMRSLFDLWKVRADISENGKKAIVHIQSKRYDVVLMDIEMPEMNGFETVQYIRDTLKLAVPVIAVSSDDREENRLMAKTCGMNDFIKKPFDPAHLFERIVCHLYGPAESVKI